jgi:nucleoside 2-deoxyribosyltransferase
VATSDSQVAEQQAAKPLKELITIICGVAATVAVAQLLGQTLRDGVYAAQFPPILPTVLFTIVLLTIGRFYHGNIRHLDEEYAGRGGKAYTGGTDDFRFSVGTRLAADFFVIAAQALLLVLLAYLIVAPFLIYVLFFGLLLLLDATWFYFFHSSSDPRSKYWAANNLGFGVAFVLLAGMLLASNSSVSFIHVGVFAALSLLNIGIDVRQQFHFYFPTRKREELEEQAKLEEQEEQQEQAKREELEQNLEKLLEKLEQRENQEAQKLDKRKKRARIIFLAAPFSDRLKEFQEVSAASSLKGDIEDLADYFTRHGYTVRSAHHREKFGRNLWPPDPALANDLEWIRGASVLVAVMDGPIPSPGVQMELGYALALQKPIVQVIKPKASLPYLNEAFEGEFAKPREIVVIKGDIRDNLNAIYRAVKDFVEAVHSHDLVGQ